MNWLSLITLTAALTQTQSTPLSEALTGSWVGTLEYRDYSGNSRERLGTLLRVSKDKANGRLSLRYVYDDGPRKVVQDEDQVDIDSAAASYTVYPTDSKTPDRYSISGLNRLSKLGFGKLILLGKATENNILVDIRETLTISARSLRVLRESRLAGQDYLFRHEYVLQRVELPK